MSSFLQRATNNLDHFSSKSNRRNDLLELRSLGSRINLDLNADPASISKQSPQLWFSFLDSERESKDQRKDTPAQITLLWTLLADIEANKDLSRNAFSNSGKWFERSLVELKTRLVGRLYKFGRRVWASYTNQADAVAALTLALSIADFSEGEIRLLNETQTRILFGFRGAIREFLGKLVPQTEFTYWDQAWKDMSRSYELGNNGLEAASFLRGITVQRFLTSNNFAFFDETLDAFNKLSQEDDQSRGELVTILSTAAPLAAPSSLALAHSLANAGVDAADAALDKSLLGETDVHRAYLKNQRAFLRTVLLQTQDELPRSQKIETLSLAITDYRDALKHQLGGSGPSFALLYRASLHFEDRNFHDCETDVSEANQLAKYITEDEKRIEVTTRARCLSNKLRFTTALESLQEEELSSSITEAIDLHPTSLFDLVHFLARFIERLKGDHSELSPNIKVSILRLLRHSHDVAVSLPPGDSAFFVSSYAANLTRTILPNGSDLASDLYRLAVMKDTARRLEPRIFAANSLLEQAKRSASESARTSDELFEESAGIYDEAIELLTLGSTASSEVIIPSIVFSKAGEAHLRAARSSGNQLESYSRAFELLSAAEASGNRTAENTGLRGDALYRRAVLTNDVGEFIEAYRLKEVARATGGVSRESLSVSSRIAEHIFRRTQDRVWLAKSVSLALQAIQADGSWAWPYFQLWDLSLRHVAQWDATISDVSTFSSVDQISDVWSAVLRRDSGYLAKKGVMVACSSAEFRRQTLGGRSGVFKIDDPHRLLGSSIVLKPTSRSDAIRETETTAALRGKLRSNPAYLGLDVVEVICSVPIDRAWKLSGAADTDTILAIRLALGRDLGRASIQQRARGGFVEVKAVERVVDLLGVFHKDTLISSTEDTTSQLKSFMRELSNGPYAATFSSLLPELSVSTLPLVRKKDAHPENWIITEQGRIVALDFEAKRLQPAFADLSQLFDDYPIIEPSRSGFDLRANLAMRYLDMIDFRSLKIDEVVQLVEVFAVWRAAVMRTFLGSKISKERSFSKLRSLNVRREHLAALTEHLAVSGSCLQLRKLSSEVNRGIRS